MTRLTLRQRYQIEANFQSGKTCAQIGAIAKVAASMVSREIGAYGAPGAFRKRAAALRAGKEVPRVSTARRRRMRRRAAARAWTVAGSS